MFNNFFSENCAAYKIIWKYMFKRHRPQMTIWNDACAITKARDTHSEHVTLIAFQRQTVVTQRCLNVTFIRTLSVCVCLVWESDLSCLFVQCCSFHCNRQFLCTENYEFFLAVLMTLQVFWNLTGRLVNIYPLSISTVSYSRKIKLFSITLLKAHSHWNLSKPV